MDGAWGLCLQQQKTLGWCLEALTAVSVRKLPCSPCFVIRPLLCQVTGKTVNVFQPFKMIEGLAHRLYSYKMRSSHQDFLWFRKVQRTFLAQSSPFPPPPVLWLLWCFLAPAEIKSRRAGYCKNGYFSRTHCACRKVWFCKCQSILFPAQNQKQECFGASDPNIGLLFGEGTGMQRSGIAH